MVAWTNLFVRVKGTTSMILVMSMFQIFLLPAVSVIRSLRDFII